jgi:hypothetical protein
MTGSNAFCTADAFCALLDTFVQYFCRPILLYAFCTLPDPHGDSIYFFMDGKRLKATKNPSVILTKAHEMSEAMEFNSKYGILSSFLLKITSDIYS